MMNPGNAKRVKESSIAASQRDDLLSRPVVSCSADGKLAMRNYVRAARLFKSQSS